MAKKINTLKERLQAFVDALPDTPLENTGWKIKPVEEDITAFHNLMQEVVDHKWGTDEDSYSCVVVDVLDLTKFEHEHWMSVPRRISRKGNDRRTFMQNRESIMLAVGCNRGIASYRQAKLMDELRRELRRDITEEIVLLMPDD